MPQQDTQNMQSKQVEAKQRKQLKSYHQYHKNPKISDGQIWATSADPDQTAPRSSLIRVYTVCNSLCIFWMHNSKEMPSYSTFRVITANFRVSEILGF